MLAWNSVTRRMANSEDSNLAPEKRPIALTCLIRASCEARTWPVCSFANLRIAALVGLQQIALAIGTAECCW